MKKEEKRPVYTLCPRCELNYITKKDKLCPVCKAEMGLLDKSILIPDEEELERICPVCKVNVLAEDEEVCFVCQKETLKDDGEQKTWLVNEDEPEDAEIEEISLELAAEEESVEPFDDEIVPGFDYSDGLDDEEGEFDKDYDDEDDDFEDFDDEDEDFDEDEDSDDDI